MKKTLLHICFMALAGALLSMPVHGDLMIYHIDVDMGDSTFIVDTGSKRTLLIDAGNRSYGRNVIAPLLLALGHYEIDYFVATHYDPAHIGGFNELVENGIRFNIVYDRGDYTDREKKTKKGKLTQYGEYIKAAGDRRQTITPVCISTVDPDQRQIDLGEDTTVEVVAASGKYLERDCDVIDANIPKDRDNALCVAMVIRHGNFSYFIGGDLTGGGNRTRDMETLIAPKVGDVDVLKINHHGSDTSTNAEFLKALMPEVAIMSVGDGGVNLRYGLPDQDVLNRLGKMTYPPIVFLTHKGEGGTLKDARIENGSIIIHTNGVGYSVNNLSLPVDEQ